jgi:signal transduction histidine kinase
LSTVAVAALTALALWPPLTRDSAALLWLDVTVAILSIAAVPVLLRRPLPAGLAVSALAALSPVATPAATVAALYTARWRRLPTAAIVAAVGLAGHAAQGLWRPNPGLPYGWWLLLTAVAYAGLVGWGALAQARAALLASLRERARRAEREQERRVAEARLAERTRIAREMHDVLAHRLSLLATYAGALEYRPDAPPEKLTAAAAVVREGVHQALNELREVVTLLREEDGSGEEDGPGESATAVDIAKLVRESRAAGVEVSFDDRVGGLPDAVARTAYRVVQEALTNARRHAAGQPVTVVLEGAAGDRLRIEVRNPLPGKESTAGGGSGLGLIGLAERVALAGGEFAHSRTAAEFRVSAWIPWDR